MKERNRGWTSLVLLVALLPWIPETARARGKGTLAARDAVTCDYLAANADGYRGRLDVVVFDHERGQLVWPQPAQLWVRSGAPFVLVVRNTNARFFSFTASAVASSRAEAGPGQGRAGEPAVATPAGNVCVSFQFTAGFPLYTVEITGPPSPSNLSEAKIREAMEVASADTRRTLGGFRGATAEEYAALLAQVPVEEPQVRAKVVAAAEAATLFPYSFPVWVRDSSAQLGFSTGLAFSDVTSDRFYVFTDTRGTAATEDDTQEVRRETSSDRFRPDLMAFATITAPRTPKAYRWVGGRLGATVGVGLGDGGDPRYFVGPSYLVGDKFLFAVGVFGGRVDRLPLGQELGQPPINGANTLNQLPKGFQQGFGFGVAWRFGAADKSEEKFLAALGPPTKQVSPEAPATSAPKPPAPGSGGGGQPQP